MPTAGVAVHQRRRFRAPQQDRGFVCDPPVDVWPEVVSANLERLSSCPVRIHGRPLTELAAQARGDLLRQAYAYTSRYRPARHPDPAGPVFLAGHQAEMFHPGVWAKNFVLDRFARDAANGGSAATAVNLVIDSDTWKSTSLACPTGPQASPIRVNVSFDEDGGQSNVPAEERRIASPAVWDSFGERLAETIAPWISDPLIRAYWPRVRERVGAGELPAAAVAQARHQIEGAWGLETLELPISATCQFEAFHGFVADLAAHWPGWRETYNESVHAYRRANRIRSRNHPVPDLAIDGDWLEMPLWVWTAEQPARRRLFVRQGAGTCTLGDRAGWTLELPRSEAGALEALKAAAQAGVKIRTRALTTTLWARLFLGDLFVHGIGGAKYDQLTDTLIERFYGIEPPGYAALSATLLLPVTRPGVTDADLRRVDGQLRELVYHPERSLDVDSLAGAERVRALEAVATKRDWIAVEPTPVNARQRTRAIRAANAALEPAMAPARSLLVQERNELAVARQVEGVLGSREYSVFLYPEKILRDFLLAFRPSTL